ncbi:MAG: glycosyltransferase family 39 protein [Myxococcales bacterium]|nr:glycosyltransferase family 39 protein [Myxococcales bacterium]
MNKRVLEAVIGVGLFGAAAGLGLYHGAVRGTWTDEAATVYLLTKSWGEIWRIAVTHDVNPFGSYLLWRLCRLGGDSLFYLRGLSALCFAISTVLLYRLGLRVGRRAAALWAALFFLATPLAQFLSAQVRYPMLLTAVVLASALALLRLVETGRTGAAVAWALFGAASFHVHYFAGFVLLAEGSFALLAARRSPWRKKIFLAAAGLVALILPWLPVLIGQLIGREAAGGGEPVRWTLLSPLTLVYLTQGFHYWQLPRFWADRLAPRADYLPLVLALPFLTALVLGSLPGGREPDKRRLLLWLGWGPMAAFLAVSLVLQLFSPHYFLPFLPFLTLLAGNGLTWLWARSKTAAGLLAVAVTVVTLGGAAELWQHPNWPEGWRPIARTIAAAAAPGDVVVLPNLPARLCYSLEKRDSLPVFHLTQGTPGRQIVAPRAAAEAMAALAARYRRALFVTYYPSRFDPTGAVAREAARQGATVTPVPGFADPRVGLQFIYFRSPFEPGGMAPQIRFPAGAQHPLQLAAGFYPDPAAEWWTAGEAQVLLPRPPDGARLEIDATVPLTLFDSALPTITVAINSRPVPTLVMPEGRLRLGPIPGPFAEPWVVVDLSCRPTFVPDVLFHDGDRRPKCLLVRSIGWSR